MQQNYYPKLTLQQAACAISSYWRDRQQHSLEEEAIMHTYFQSATDSALELVATFVKCLQYVHAMFTSLLIHWYLGPMVFFYHRETSLWHKCGTR